MPLANFDKAIKYKPNDFRSYLGRGKTVAALGNSTEALADFKKAIQLNARCAEAHLECGKVYYQRGDLQSALRSFNAALGLVITTILPPFRLECQCL